MFKKPDYIVSVTFRILICGAHMHTVYFFVFFSNCQICVATFKNHITYSKHMRKLHSANYAINCSLCNEELEGEHAYEAHLAEKHSDKVVVCSVCAKMFDSKSR